MTMRLGGGAAAEATDAPAPAAPATDERAPEMSDPEVLYELLVEGLEELSSGEQMSVAMALQQGTEWAQLDPKVRALFERISGEFLDGGNDG